MTLPYQSAFTKYLPLAVLIVLVLLASRAFAAELPKVFMLGPQSAECQEAAYKVIYIEARVGVVPNHIVNVHCTEESYRTAIEKLGVAYAQSPDGTSLLKARITHLNASSLLRITGDNRHRGDFLIAHEVGHFATDSGLEWRADAWASDALKKYVPVSFEEFRKNSLAAHR